MSLNLWALSYILEVAKAGSISKAAQNLYLSQPHLSNTIKMVEKELEVSIFQRTTKGMVLTNDGEIFVRKAQSIMAEMSSLESMFSTPPEDTLQIRISTIRCHRIQSCITDMINKNTDKSHFLVHIKETNPFQVLEDVRNNSADLGVIGIFDAQKEYFLNAFMANSLEYTFHYSQEYLLLMSEDNPLSKEVHIKGEMLESQIAVLFGDYETVAASYTMITENSGIVLPYRRIYAYDRATALQTLSECPCTYTWVSGLPAKVLKQQKLITRRCEDVQAKKLGYTIYSSNAPLSRIMLDLQRQLEQTYWADELSQPMDSS